MYFSDWETYIYLSFNKGVKELPNEQKQDEVKDKETNKSETEGSPAKSVFSNSPSIASISSLSKIPLHNLYVSLLNVF